MSAGVVAVTATVHRAEIEWHFARHARSVGRARDALRAQLKLWDFGEDTAEAAVLVLSELMGNSVRHAHVPVGREVWARFVLSGDGLRLEVSDASSEQPKLRQVADDAEEGRGLSLVDALSGGNWGVCSRDGIGKTVWAIVKPSPMTAIQEVVR